MNDYAYCIGKILSGLINDIPEVITIILVGVIFVVCVTVFFIGKSR